MSWLSLPAQSLVASQSEIVLPQATAEDQVLMESGQQLASQISTIEWLGPLAPIALSPFFGMACLSGIATFGPEWLQHRSGLLSESSPLSNPTFFGTMAILTIATSLPRFSKVSKPIALIAEKLETYSVVIILIALRSMGAPQETVDVETAMAPHFLVAGIGSVSFDFLLTIVAALNILVVNSVKLFCELMIWLTPFPLVDAVFEVSNKVICLGLMGLYSWSPTAATILNLILFAICGYVYFWTKRRMVYYSDLLAGPLVRRWLPWGFRPNDDGDRVFLAEAWQGLPVYTALRLKRTNATCWQLTRHGWFRSQAFELPNPQWKFESGLLADTLVGADEGGKFVKLDQRKGSSVQDAVGRGGSVVGVHMT